MTKTVAPKLAFESGGRFIRDTRSEVEAYLADRRTRRRGQIQLYAKAPVGLGLMVASWSLLLFAPHSLLLGVPLLAGMVLATMIIAFSVQHDANHGAYTRSRRVNHLIGLSADGLLGFSSYVWRVKHNVAHHTYTNVTGYDDDIAQAPLARFAPAQTVKPWYRFQHYYVWLLYMFMGLRWQSLGDIASFSRGRVGTSTLRFPRGWDLVGLLGGKSFFVTWAIAIPLLVYPWWIVLTAYLGFVMVTSLVMATTFQLAHCVEEASFASPGELDAERRVWAVHEVETTVDFCPRNPILTWLLGGLNFQIEHHLFPRVPHTHYPAIARIVAANCARHGVRYTSQPSLRLALRSHFLHLRSMGRQGLPIELEMG